MKQDLKDYFRRTIFIHTGVIAGQFLILCLGVGNITKSLTIIAILEIVLLIGYVIIFGVKRKDGTLIRLKKIDNFMVEYEETEIKRKETVKMLQAFIDKHERKKNRGNR